MADGTEQIKRVVARRRTAVLFMAGAALGAAAFLLIYGLSPLDVTNDAFCRGGYIEKDIQQHYAGWLFYRQSGASFPLCIADNINWPNGLSIAYTDSIPLFAAFFKLLSPILPQTFQYFGWFTFFCFILQGAFSAILLGLFTQRLFPPVLASLLFIFSPVLLERAFRHTSLGAQFFILAVLYYYFKTKREDKFAYRGLFALNILCITIHPYYLPMVYAITLAMLLEYAVRHKRLLQPALYLIADLLLTLAAGWAFGLLYGTADGGSEALYGYFGLNLNVLWNPSGVNGVLWSGILPAQNQVGGNYDAFAYLGLGVILALVIGAAMALLRGRLHPARLARAHWALLAACAVLTAFAISNVVTANGATLLTLPLPQKIVELFSAFRSSGRMFWPVYYLLMLAAFVLIVRNVSGRLLTVAVAAVVAVQLIDISPGIMQRHEAMLGAANAAFPSDLDMVEGSFWQQASARYAHIASMDGIQDDALHLALYAADNGMTTNDPFAARYDTAALAAQREALAQELAEGVLQQDTLYIFSDEGIFLNMAEAVKDVAWCGKVSCGDSCWYVIAPGMQGASLGSGCTRYDDEYPLQITDYTDALWRGGVLTTDKKTVCFTDSPFARRKLVGAGEIICDGVSYKITNLDDGDSGWLMITLDIPDATVLCGKTLETK